MPSFSRVTIIEAIKAFGFSTHAPLDNLVLRFDLETADLEGVGIEKREAVIIRYLIDNPDLKGPKGANIVFEIIELFVEERFGYDRSVRRNRYWGQDPEELFPKLVRALKRDGYVIEDAELRPLLPEEFHIAASESELERLLEKHNFTTPKGHLDQALNAYSRGDWAAANSQIRPFVEGLFDDIARSLDPAGAARAGDSNARRELLSRTNPPFFLPALNEWLGNGTGFVQGYYRRLHPAGSHPGLSDEDDTTFRLHMVMVVMSYFMKRFDDI